MTAPAFLTSSFYYYIDYGVSSMETVLNDIVAALALNSPGWTVTDNRPGTDSVTCVSPVDSSVTPHRFFTCVFSNVSGHSNLWLQCVTTDQNGVTLGTFVIEGTASNTWIMRYFTGQFHIIVDIEKDSAASEALVAGILDLSPEAQSAHSHYCYCHGSRNSSGALANNNLWFASMVDNVTVTDSNRVVSYNNSYSYGNPQATLRSPAGSFIFKPVIHVATNTLNTVSQAGRRYQQLLGSSNLTTEGGTLVVPTDIGSTGTFMMVGGLVSTGGATLFARVA